MRYFLFTEITKTIVMMMMAMIIMIITLKCLF